MTGGMRARSNPQGAPPPPPRARSTLAQARASDDDEVVGPREPAELCHQ
eukprot:CAMPEP_0182900330 /NCGR_PEP_ID=MMETSP0034_2-20130328/28766_1 /TAXON_ID=156128 /ORGANISM="Nephroselmis pyriformis, Strain CCMP717" /LENGTH=48 /DNA_ID= /DNA_START= /DNA_END= /DNA_ORIENTATION=